MAEVKVKNEKLKMKNTTTKEKIAKVGKKVVAKKSEVHVEDAQKETRVNPLRKKASKGQEKETTKHLTLDVFDTNGKVVGKQHISSDVFGTKINKQLIAQAVRVYLANQRQGNASTKTRGEVSASTRKIYRQKGTGRARHGSLKAPLFVHYGGVAWGPRPRDFGLNIPQKMKQQALACALSAKVKDQELKIVSGLEKLDGKTKSMVGALANLKVKTENIKKNPKILLVINDGAANVIRAARNIDRVTITAAARLNVYDVLTAKQLLFSKDAVESLEARFKM